MMQPSSRSSGSPEPTFPSTPGSHPLTEEIDAFKPLLHPGWLGEMDPDFHCCQLIGSPVELGDDGNNVQYLCRLPKLICPGHPKKSPTSDDPQATPAKAVTTQTKTVLLRTPTRQPFDSVEHGIYMEEPFDKDRVLEWLQNDENKRGILVDHVVTITKKHHCGKVFDYDPGEGFPSIKLVCGHLKGKCMIHPDDEPSDADDLDDEEEEEEEEEGEEEEEEEDQDIPDADHLDVEKEEDEDIPHGDCLDVEEEDEDFPDIDYLDVEEEEYDDIYPRAFCYFFKCGVQTLDANDADAVIETSSGELQQQGKQLAKNFNSHWFFAERGLFHRMTLNMNDWTAGVLRLENSATWKWTKLDHESGWVPVEASSGKIVLPQDLITNSIAQCGILGFEAGHDDTSASALSQLIQNMLSDFRITDNGETKSLLQSAIQVLKDFSVTIVQNGSQQTGLCVLPQGQEKTFKALLQGHLKTVYKEFLYRLSEKASKLVCDDSYNTVFACRTPPVYFSSDVVIGSEPNFFFRRQEQLVLRSKYSCDTIHYFISKRVNNEEDLFLPEPEPSSHWLDPYPVFEMPVRNPISNVSRDGSIVVPNCFSYVQLTLLERAAWNAENQLMNVLQYKDALGDYYIRSFWNLGSSEYRYTKMQKPFSSFLEAGPGDYYYFDEKALICLTEEEVRKSMHGGNAEYQMKVTHYLALLLGFPYMYEVTVESDAVGRKVFLVHYHKLQGVGEWITKLIKISKQFRIKSLAVHNVDEDHCARYFNRSDRELFFMAETLMLIPEGFRFSENKDGDGEYADFWGEQMKWGRPGFYSKILPLSLARMDEIRRFFVGYDGEELRLRVTWNGFFADIAQDKAMTELELDCGIKFETSMAFGSDIVDMPFPGVFRNRTLRWHDLIWELDTIW